MTPTPPLQPLLDDAVIMLEAPTQAWSDDIGRMGTAPIHGIYHGDVRHIRSIEITVDGTALESIGCVSAVPQQTVLTDLLRGLDDESADPKVRMDRDRRVAAGAFSERITITSHLDAPVATAVTVRVLPDFAPMQEVKAGLGTEATWSWDGSICRAGEASFTLTAPEAAVTQDGEALVLRWDAVVPPRGSVALGWAVDLDDPT
ncbi:glycogen debranching N-terminal domain-containing protein, partial [Microbacterium sp. H6]